MRLVRFYLPGAGTRIGLWEDSEVVDLTSIDENLFCCFTELLRQTYVMDASIEEVVNEQVEGHRGVSKHYEYSLLDRPPSQTEPHLLMPLKPLEVWGAGITYIRSRAARETETKAKGIYAWLYDSARPEIFFKATLSRCVGPNEAICIRSDSTWTVPEPELAFILGDKEDIIGFTAGNDVSCRDIEGENRI